MSDTKQDDQSLQPPEAQPIKSLEDLDKWRPEEHLLTVGTVPYPSASPAAISRRQTLVCHDMAGGYLHDRFSQGCQVGDAYKFYHWQYVDSFIYFSHYFITIPPPGWINAAHKHNVKMLGTLITEWDEGLQRCKDFLASEESCLNLAKKLTQLAQHYGFDGWLVNIENVVEEEKVPLLVDFVRQLTKMMHTALPHSQVIWYDSVISTGKLKWQDELNEKNSLFFNVCDGIFLNYNWKDESLERTRELAKKCNRPFDAYVGVDVFGRGCRGGGGFNTKEAVKAAFDFDLSVAIFAQGWVYEKLEKKEDFTERENKFWSLIHHFCPTHTSLELPFVTNFCHGQGDAFFSNGELVKPGPWTNLALQGPQPTHFNSQFDPSEVGEEEPGPSMNIHKGDVFMGGNSLKLSGKIAKNGKHLTYSLFDTSCPLPSKVYLCYSFKNLTDLDVDLLLDVKVKTSSEERVTSLGGKASVGDVMKPMTSEEVAGLLTNYRICDGENGWNSRHYILNCETSSCLLGIDAKIVNSQQTDVDAQVLLGNLQLVDAEELKDLPLITNLRVSRSLITQTKPSEEGEKEEEKGKKLISAELKWTFPENTADYYTVYYRTSSTGSPGGSEYKSILGHSHTGTYRVVNLELGEKVSMVTFMVEPTLRSGLRPRKCPDVGLDV